MEKYYKIENYLPIGLLFLLFLNVFLVFDFMLLFIFHYILVGVFLAINTWRMKELNTINKEKWNSVYYWAYAGIFLFIFILGTALMSMDSGV